MKTRIITGVLMLAAWLGLLYLNSYTFFWMTGTLLTLLCAHEFFTMHGEGGTSRLSGLVLTALPVISLALIPSHDLLMAALLLALLLSALRVIWTAGCNQPYPQLSNRLFALIYIGFTIPHIVLLAGFKNGALWLLILTAITAASDSGAYFCGRTVGRHKLCPHISPGKTIEGFIGGVICGTLCATAFSYYFFPNQSLLAIAIVAVLLSCLGVAGDLTESIIKRATNTKDSGRLLPGHGGFLDRLDSMIFCAPALYYILYFGLL